MKTIWKFPLRPEASFTVNVPKGATFLHVGVDPQGEPCLWAEVDPGANVEPWILSVVMTGGDVPFRPRRHLGTFLVGSIVAHVYREERKERDHGR